MKKTSRRMAAGLSVAGLLATTVGAGAYSANADSRTLLVTLSGGRQVTITADAPPGTPVDQISLPDLGAPVISVSDITPAAPKTTTSTTTTTKKPDSSNGKPSSPAGNGGSKNSGKDGSKPSGSSKSSGSSSSSGSSKSSSKTQTAKERAIADATTTAPAATPSATPTPGIVGVPNFVIEDFKIPPALLPIYQAAGIEYGIRWEVLAAINEVETNFGRNLSVSTAGALGWMQFMPDTWDTYGVDASGDGKKDPYNARDAIFAAARYLRASGGDKDIKKAIFDYNHAYWYVDMVMVRARLFAGIPADLVNSLTGLTEGVFPIPQEAEYAGDSKKSKKSKQDAENKELNIFSAERAPAIAVQDGTVVAIGESKKLGRYVKLRDAFGNVYTYSNLDSVSAFHAVPKEDESKSKGIEREAIAPPKDPKPTAPATDDGKAGPRSTKETTAAKPAATEEKPSVTASKSEPVATDLAATNKERLFANPNLTNNGDEQIANQNIDSGAYSSYLTLLKGVDKGTVKLKKLEEGSRVIVGTPLGKIAGKADAAHLRLQIRPAGKKAPLIDPEPIVSGWKLLEATQTFNSKGQNPLVEKASIGQILLMSKAQLQQRVLANKNIEIYPGGENDIASGAIDRRVMATLEYLTANGLKITVSSLRGNHGYYTASGNVSAHSSGNAVDISAVNGIPISGNQGVGSITDSTIRLLLGLKGAMEPNQIISLMTFAGAPNTLSLPDHDDHIHVGFSPTVSNDPELNKQVQQILKPSQWGKLIDRIAQIDNPIVSPKPSKYAERASKSDRVSNGD